MHLLHMYLQYGQRDTETKTLLGTFKWLKHLLLIHFLSLSRAYECFQWANLTITLLSCPLLFLESRSLWQPSISFGSISTPEFLQILITVFSRPLSGMVFGVSDISVLFLQLYSSPFVWFFSRYTILSLSLIVCHEVFCFQEITEMNIGPIKGHTYLNKPAAFSKLFPW